MFVYLTSGEGLVQQGAGLRFVSLLLVPSLVAWEGGSSISDQTSQAESPAVSYPLLSPAASKKSITLCWTTSVRRLVSLQWLARPCDTSCGFLMNFLLFLLLIHLLSQNPVDITIALKDCFSLLPQRSTRDPVQSERDLVT